MLPVGLCVQLACVWEVTARKPGNVHRYRDFEDASYLDFILSAAAIAPVLDGAARRPVGQAILEAVRATRLVARTNTNLGILLLLSPLVAGPAGEPLRDGLVRLLARLDVADARAAYEAIRLANPGGMGRGGRFARIVGRRLARLNSPVPGTANHQHDVDDFYRHQRLALTNSSTTSRNSPPRRVSDDDKDTLAVPSDRRRTSGSFL
jgi:triphosphoribosyl-dephospho-CoA synthetase